MSTASPSVPAASPSQYGASAVQHAQTPVSHGNAPPMHGHTGSGMTPASESHVGHTSGVGLYPDSVQPTPHHLAAGSFPNAQISPMTSPYGAYGAAQHPMYGGSYSGHAYPPYPSYMGHLSHYGHPPHYPAMESGALACAWCDAMCPAAWGVYPPCGIIPPIIWLWYACVEDAAG